MNEILEHLTHGEIEVSGRLVDASNATLYATSTFNGEELPVIYKPIAGERPLWDFTDGNLASRELAAYLISSYADWNIVPPTVMRDGPFGIGMVQQWIEIDESIDLALFYRERDSQLRTMVIFDSVINNTDRKIGHLLPDSSGHLFGCDHGVTFHPEDKLRTVLWQWAGEEISESEKDQLSSLLEKIERHTTELEGLLTLEEIDALKFRTSRLISESSFPIPSQEWPSIPWPPF